MTVERRLQELVALARRQRLGVVEHLKSLLPLLGIHSTFASVSRIIPIADLGIPGLRRARMASLAAER